jgi:hypothetical protein
MNLEGWLKQDRSLADQLKVMEGLCSALNDGHQRGVLHRGLDPANVEVATDGSCDLSGAEAGGNSDPRYAAPEIAEGAAHSPQSDIYSAGVIFYEMLSGRSPSPDRPTPLADIRPDVPRDLTDAVMGCLEKGPDWRPKDLSYLLQVVRSLRSQGAGKGGKAAARAVEPARSSPSRPAAGMGRKPTAPGSTSNTPLLVAVGVLLLGAGGGAWYWLQGSSTPPVTQTAGIRPTPPPTTTLAPSAPPETPVPVAATPVPKATPDAPLATPTPGATPKAATPPPVTAAPRPTPEAPARTPEPLATPVPTPPPTPAGPKPEEIAAATEPTVLTAVSPLQIKRGVTTMLDVRGNGLRADQKATVLKIKEQPNGITVVKQKFVNGGLIQVVVKLEDTTAPGVYGLAMGDTLGGLSNALSFTVAK